MTVKVLPAANPAKPPLLKTWYPSTPTSSAEDVHASLTASELCPVEDSVGAEGAVRSGGASCGLPLRELLEIERLRLQAGPVGAFLIAGRPRERPARR